jgi:N-carbamoylputrescine amidase
MTFTVALLQITLTEMNPEFNLRKGIDDCRRAKALAADLVLFPEMWHIGYAFCPPDKKDEWEAAAIEQQSDFFQAYVHAAKELGVHIALTYLERYSPEPRNSVSIINSMGEVVLTYAKVFLCNFGQEELQKQQYHLDDVGRDYNCTPGTTFDVCELTTGEGAVKVGAMICADREFPEAAGTLMKNGAELIIVPNSCEWDDIRDSQLKTRAFENLVGIAMANYPKPKNNGQSTAYSPVAFNNNPLLVKAKESEDIALATFDMDTIREFRRQEQWRLDYRLNFKP